MDWPSWWVYLPTESAFTSISKCTQTKILTGIPYLDQRLEGLITGQIYEITGEAGTGKTNLALEISKNICQRSKVFYLSTQKPLSQPRLSSMKLNSENFLSCYNPDLQSTLKFIAEDLREVADRGLGLFVLDNIYTLAQNEAVDVAEKNSLVQRLAIVIKYLSFKYNFAVLIVNNVIGFNNEVIPGLGVHWSYCVNFRFFLSRDGNRKKIKVLFTNSAIGEFECHVVIDNDGVRLDVIE